MLTHRPRQQKRTEVPQGIAAPSSEQIPSPPVVSPPAGYGHRFADIAVQPPAPVQRKENRTGLPDDLKAGVESLSGLSLDDVRVHYNSSRPADVQALAYARGTEIHVGPGQEKHLPHEAWHVAQQKQGRVAPTFQAKRGAINDDRGLEREADVMGAEASRTSPAEPASAPAVRQVSPAVIQRVLAEVDYAVNGTVHHIAGEQVGQGGIGGVSHSEQKVWANARTPILNALSHANANVIVTFDVDEKICPLCRAWFENTVYPRLQQAAQAGHSTFTLRVNALGNSLDIQGGATIWPPEVTDDPTFERMPPAQRGMRFLTENRDEQGNLNDEDQSPHVSGQVELLQELMDNWGHFGLTLGAIETSMDEGKDDAIRMNEGRYDEDTDAGTMEEYCDTLTFYDAFSGGMVSVPPLVPGSDVGASVQNWLGWMRHGFSEWFNYQMEIHLPAKQKAYPHGS